MDDLLVTSLKLHTIFLGCMMIVGCINLVFVFSAKEFSKKVKLLNPLYYMFFAMVGFTGVIILTANQMHVSHASMTMILVFVIIFALSIKLFKVYKHQSQEKYRSFAKKKYLIDLALIVITIVLVYAV